MNPPLRDFQKITLQAIEDPHYLNHHILCVAPTGSGKSRIYEIAAQTRKTLLITPLIALARQQTLQLQSLGLNVYWKHHHETSIDFLNLQVWILSPESLDFSHQILKLRRWRPEFLVVDECHCIWEWSDYFRPAFSKVPKLIFDLTIQKSLWLTATLPPPARQLLKDNLPQKITEIGAFNLPPMIFKVLKTAFEDRLHRLIQILAQKSEPTLIFAPTRQLTLRIGTLVRSFGKRTMTYHAGLSLEERRNLEAQFSQALGHSTPVTLDCIVATSAFGLGMNYPQLQHVILWQAPTSLLALVQAIGRVCRNTQSSSSTATLLWHPDDFKLLEWTLGSSQKRKQDLMDLLMFLNTPLCRNIQLKNYFNIGTLLYAPCGACDVCLVD